MSKNIGIKLADGTFYPILVDGTPDKKVLNLTTVKDNQTTVQVDLYRSETNSMDDAEYVDTLQIDNLVAHPNGEPNINLNISLDENNKLSAEISDPESGEHSDITVTLVSRTLEERTKPVNYDVAADEPQNDVPVHTGGLLAAAEAKRAALQEEPIIEDDLDLDDDTTVQVEPAIESEKVSFEEDKVDLDEDTDLSAMQTDDLNEGEPKEEAKDNLDLDDLDFDMPELDTELSTVPIDFDIPEEETPKAEESTTTEEPLPFNEADLDLPDFDSTDVPKESELPSFDDFDDKTETAPINPASTDLDEMDFDMPDFGTSTSTDTSDNIDFSSTPTAGGLDFSDLYDDETVEGISNDQDSKITRKHVIICVICAIICIIATILILFVVPSPINLIASRNTKGTISEAPAETPAQQAESPVVVDHIAPEQPTKPVVPEAKENEIVISPTPTIVPQAPKPKAAEPTNIRYKIKWGDTLWDISDAYYKTPWKYKTIAQYNRIKNPDYIISGTYITIPAK